VSVITFFRFMVAWLVPVAMRYSNPLIWRKPILFNGR
jgi:hypothetical protein